MEGVLVGASGELRLISALRTPTTCCCQMQNTFSVQSICSKIPAMSSANVDVWDQLLSLILKLLLVFCFYFIQLAHS